MQAAADRDARRLGVIQAILQGGPRAHSERVATIDDRAGHAGPSRDLPFVFVRERPSLREDAPANEHDTKAKGTGRQGATGR